MAKINVRVQGVARVKKFRDDQDPEKDEPAEIIERNFELTEEQANEVAANRAYVAPENGETVVKHYKTGKKIPPRMK